MKQIPGFRDYSICGGKLLHTLLRTIVEAHRESMGPHASASCVLQSCRSPAKCRSPEPDACPWISACAAPSSSSLAARRPPAKQAPASGLRVLASEVHAKLVCASCLGIWGSGLGVGVFSSLFVQHLEGVSSRALQNIGRAACTGTFENPVTSRGLTSSEALRCSTIAACARMTSRKLYPKQHLEIQNTYNGL